MASAASLAAPLHHHTELAFGWGHVAGRAPHCGRAAGRGIQEGGTTRSRATDVASPPDTWQRLVALFYKTVTVQ